MKYIISRVLFGRMLFLEKDGQTSNVEHIYREKTDKRILKKNPWKDYNLHITVLVLVIIAQIIGPKQIPIANGVEVDRKSVV